MVYLVEFTDETRETPYGQVGGFTSKAEAEKLCELLRSEGQGPVVINMVPIHRSVTDWEYDR